MHQACSLSRMVLTCIVSGATLTRGGMGAERCVAEERSLSVYSSASTASTIPSNLGGGGWSAKTATWA
eukprot:6318911-Prymnesium_polylepis.1